MQKFKLTIFRYMKSSPPPIPSPNFLTGLARTWTWSRLRVFFKLIESWERTGFCTTTSASSVRNVFLNLHLPESGCTQVHLHSIYFNSIKLTNNVSCIPNYQVFHPEVSPQKNTFLLNKKVIKESRLYHIFSFS